MKIKYLVSTFRYTPNNNIKSAKLLNQLNFSGLGDFQEELHKDGKRLVLIVVKFIFSFIYYQCINYKSHFVCDFK